MTDTDPSTQLAALLARLPHTADGKPILLGDTIYTVNRDPSYWGDDPILEGNVETVYLGLSFPDYKGQFTVCTDEWESGNLDCWADKANVPDRSF